MPGTMDKRFKFKSLQTFCNNEWMANNQKRYRSVFDAAEVDYIRIELALYNKRFDEEDWATPITLKCIEGLTGKEVCLRAIEVKGDKREHLLFVRDGWGVEQKGGFWKKGVYRWQAYADDFLLGERTFYINEIGDVDALENPYFEIESLRLYCSDINGWQDRDRIYLKRFSKKNTRYVWVEFRFRNQTPKEYHFEFFLNFYDDAGLPKASVTHTGYIGPEREGHIFTFEKAWGSDLPGIWSDDRYLLEVVFHNKMIAATAFTCGETEEQGETPILRTLEQTLNPESGLPHTPLQGEQPSTAKTLEELLDELDALIGLENVKSSIRQNITFLRFTKLRQEKGFVDASRLNLHSVFTGNPGTGKTTVVKMLGKIYHQMGLLSKGHVVEVDRAALVGEYIGQTAPKTKKVIESARGGVLFIDEAYALSRGEDDNKDFGKEVIEILLKEMSDGVGDIAIIAAGYPKQMQNFIKSNPGLKSRFTEYFHFDDYLPEELFEIAVYACRQKEVQMTEEASNYLREQLTEAYRKRTDFFGNARFVFAVVEEAKQNMGIRLMKYEDFASLSHEDLSTLILEDLRNVFKTESRKKLRLNIHEKQLHDALEELNELVGMEDIKQDVHELIKLIRFYNETGKDVINRFSLHSVFTGNPGTGKTTLARIMGRIYKALGLLERGHVVEVDRESLVAGYVGQTATKTAATIDSAIGGILFIDEAYALANKNSTNDFGTEAIQILLKRMEDDRGNFGVIVAGYTENMHLFIESNPGFKSRFDKTFEFDDYSAAQLWEITLNLLQKEGLSPDEEAEKHLRNYLHMVYENRDKFFGNARTARQLVIEIVRKQNLRLASIPSTERKKSDLGILNYQDVKHLEVLQEGRSSLGFRFGN